MITAMEDKQPVAFISGHTDISPTLFNIHYAERIDAALHASHAFVLGDAIGVDSLALEYLLSRSAIFPGLKERITVYASRPYNVPRLAALGVNVVAPGRVSGADEEMSLRFGRRTRHILRDGELTAASDYDVLWVRSEEESRLMYGHKWRSRVSATELNRLRREQKKSERDAQRIKDRGHS